jgi:hypothetical protein
MGRLGFRFLPGLLACAAAAHVVSMSSGDLAIEGVRAHFELRMPLYEIAHVPQPENTLLENIRFASGGRAAKLLTKTCRAEPARDTYLCNADYEFAAPVETLDVDCTLASVTVPNHVHVLRVSMGDRHDQGFFDRSFTRETLRFRPPTPAEAAVTETGAGFLRALGGPAQILFLAALALAARSRRELAALAGTFLLGQAASVWIVPTTGWQPAARFVEAAAALTVAYLAMEILLLPQAGARSLVAGVLGVFHGLYFHLFIQTSSFRPGWVLLGAAAAQLLVTVLLALVFSRIGRVFKALRPLQVAASGLLVFGMVWFFLRLRS